MQTMEEMVKENYKDTHRKEKYECKMSKKMEKIERDIKRAAQKGYSNIKIRFSLFTSITLDDLEYMAKAFEKLGYATFVGYYTNSIEISWEHMIK